MRTFFLSAAIALSSTTTTLAVDDGSTPPPKTETSTKCSGEKIFDEETRKCVDAQQKSFNDNQRYDAIRELAYAGKYDRALSIIAVADDPEDPRFLNYRGFIARKTGRMAEAIEFYAAALDRNPDYLLARAYLGQGLVEIGDIDGAKEQLREISARGGKGTWPHFALKQSLRAGPSSAY